MFILLKSYAVLSAKQQTVQFSGIWEFQVLVIDWVGTISTIVGFHFLT